jgi:hypothetical protein
MELSASWWAMRLPTGSTIRAARRMEKVNYIIKIGNPVQCSFIENFVFETFEYFRKPGKLVAGRY